MLALLQVALCLVRSCTYCHDAHVLSKLHHTPMSSALSFIESFDSPSIHILLLRSLHFLTRSHKSLLLHESLDSSFARCLSLVTTSLCKRRKARMMKPHHSPSRTPTFPQIVRSPVMLN
mmetsp:Transcript_36935/g.115776  ORF Transcript_36935/g.115776 Transcript_36935/m.115776 type:complete len:119 (-) Transcript_36935:2102-2458(-)